MLCPRKEKKLRSDDFHSELHLSKPEEDESLGAAQLSEKPDQSRLLLALLNLVGVGIGSAFQMNGFFSEIQKYFFHLNEFLSDILTRSSNNTHCKRQP